MIDFEIVAPEERFFVGKSADVRAIHCYALEKNSRLL
jgi:hypothetical protein